MSRLEITVWMKTPSGDVHDITSRTDIDSIGRISEEIEEDLTALTHPDMDLTLYDEDGWVWALFEGAARTAVYEFWIERERAGGDGYERVFGGIADLPFGVQRSTKDRTVQVTVYGYGKLLELASAETIQRTVTGRTGTVTSGTATVTCNDTTDLAAGDEITLDNGTNRETRTIASVDSATQVTTTENYSASFSAADLSLDTPYYRSLTVAALAELLFAEAGITDTQIDTSQALSSVPFPSEPNTTNVPTTAPVGLIESSGEIKVYTGGKRYGADTITSGFTDEGADTAKADWKPYKTTEPGTLRAVTTTDNGARAWDYDGGDYYSLAIDVSENLQLYKNGSALVQVQAGGTGGGAVNTYDVLSVEWHEGLSEVWVGYHWKKKVGTLTTGFARAIKRYDSSGTLLGTLSEAAELRYSAAMSRMLALEWGGVGAALTDDGPIGLYDGASRVGELAHADGVIVWTLRAMGDHVLGLRTAGVKSYCTVWDQATGEILADYLLADAYGGTSIATVFDEGGTATPIYVCYVAGEWFALSTEFSTVIPYADFDGDSCAAALKKLAVISGALLWVDDEKTGYLIGRDAAFLEERDAVEIGTPLEQTVWPLSEWHRTSVMVTAKEEDGDDIEVLTGERGDSALRLEVSADLPITSGLASALANAYLSWTSGIGAQYDEEIEEPAAGRVRVLDRVTRDGRTYRVLRVESDLIERTQTLQLVEEDV